MADTENEEYPCPEEFNWDALTEEEKMLASGYLYTLRTSIKIPDAEPKKNVVVRALGLASGMLLSLDESTKAMPEAHITEMQLNAYCPPGTGREFKLVEKRKAGR